MKIVLPVSGMTCAACQSRVQRALLRAPGVTEAVVNLMMNSATVSFDPSATTLASLVEVIHASGYGASLPDASQDPFAAEEARDHARSAESRELTVKAVVSAAAEVTRCGNARRAVRSPAVKSAPSGSKPEIRQGPSSRPSSLVA